MARVVHVRHWFPILTFCPVNGLPDFIYITVTFHDTWAELYSVRKIIKKCASFKEKYMEDIAKSVLSEIPNAHSVTVNLAFSRHTVIESRN